MMNITPTLLRDIEELDVEDMNVPGLRKLCVKTGLDEIGTKRNLFDRLKEFVMANPSGSTSHEK